MTRPFRVAYVVLDAWTLVGVVLRIIVQLSHGYPLDVLPFITATLGISALIAFAATRRASVGFYIALVAWDLVGSAARVIFQLAEHEPLDVIPLVSVVAGISGLVILFIAPTSPEETQPDAQIHGR